MVNPQNQSSAFFEIVSKTLDLEFFSPNLAQIARQTFLSGIRVPDQKGQVLESADDSGKRINAT
jgi:hypothetical protein